MRATGAVIITLRGLSQFRNYVRAISPSVLRVKMRVTGEVQFEQGLERVARSERTKERR
jgi:hypothetical protein